MAPAPPPVFPLTPSLPSLYNLTPPFPLPLHTYSSLTRPTAAHKSFLNSSAYWLEKGPVGGVWEKVMQSEQRGFGERQLREWERVRRADETRLQKGKGKGKDRSEEREREDEMEVDGEENSQTPEQTARASKSSTPSSKRISTSPTPSNSPKKRSRGAKWVKPPEFVKRDIPEYEFPEVDIPEDYPSAELLTSLHSHYSLHLTQTNNLLPPLTSNFPQVPPSVSEAFKLLRADYSKKEDQMAFRMSSQEWAEHKKGRKKTSGKGDRDDVWIDAERGLEGSALVAIGYLTSLLLSFALTTHTAAPSHPQNGASADMSSLVLREQEREQKQAESLLKERLRREGIKEKARLAEEDLDLGVLGPGPDSAAEERVRVRERQRPVVRQRVKKEKVGARKRKMWSKEFISDSDEE